MTPDVKIGFIPLVDAASLLVAADKGFAADEGLAVELVRDVSWSNMRDRLAIGHYDAAHLLAPMAVASTLGLSHVRVKLVAALNLAANGNAITVSRALHAQMTQAADGALGNPAVSARALRSVIRDRERRGDDPLTFGMTFPFSTHNYQLRYWMAEGGIDPDHDLRLVVLPPPYMVDNLAKGQVDGFCVGAPWNAVAADAGLGVILHPGCAIFHPAPEKTLALRDDVAARDPQRAAALIRAVMRAADFVRDPENRAEVAALLARPDRVGVDAQTIRRTLDGRLDAQARTAQADYLLFGDARTGRPDPYQAAWLYAQMLRWRQAAFSPEHLRMARAVFDPRFFDAACATAAPPTPIRAFAGPAFDADDIRAYVAAFGRR
ncbi:MAG: CmpA/NrtA family ABC transporter substrate-binding protein [Methylocystis sp.]|uniref:CmpA/NrtA family ABC transporter substrate-binding protein n=1 Tax=Methylocystis sp. TaxID=1911079 RepID=UPI003DA25219